MRSYFDRLLAPARSESRLVSAVFRRCGATSHARSCSDTLEAAPAGCTRPSEAAPERFRPRIGASGASKTKEFLKKNTELLFFAVSAPGVSLALRNAPRTTPGRPSGAPRWLPAPPRAPQSRPEASLGATSYA